ncbi:hypothetical protein [Agarivorans sp. DSG3-1]|uniref:hypothetical protein n=1 Tax=Agarivorans sp. DSG3-1 TaxID=3342249 RepID=UPI00398F03EA
MLIVIFSLISFIHVPYIQSELIENIAYYVVLPITLVPILILFAKEQEEELFKVALVGLLLASAFITWFSLYAMAWPTFWWASIESNNLAIIGSNVSNSKGGYNYDLHLSKYGNDKKHVISTTEDIYNIYKERCDNFNMVPVQSKEWWAGSVVTDETIKKAIFNYCS